MKLLAKEKAKDLRAFTMMPCSHSTRLTERITEAKKEEATSFKLLKIRLSFMGLSVRTTSQSFKLT